MNRLKECQRLLIAVLYDSGGNPSSGIRSAIWIRGRLAKFPTIVIVYRQSGRRLNLRKILYKSHGSGQSGRKTTMREQLKDSTSLDKENFTEVKHATPARGCRNFSGKKVERIFFLGLRVPQSTATKRKVARSTIGVSGGGNILRFRKLYNKVLIMSFLPMNSFLCTTRQIVSTILSALSAVILFIIIITNNHLGP